MQIGIPAEIRAGETRVAATPETVKKLAGSGHHELLVQSGAGAGCSIPDSEFATLGCNVLAVAPREVLMVAGNLETRARLERAGVTVHEFAGREICLKGGGGPTCLIRPLTRDRS